MDATMMVVASVPTPVNGTPGKSNNTGDNAVASTFKQLLAGSINQENPNGGQLASVANLAAGAGQLNQILAQIVARLNSGNPVASEKGDQLQENSSDKELLNFPQEILNALMALLQTLQTTTQPGQDNEVAQNSPDGGSNNQSILLILEGLSNQKGLKGEVGIELQRIISEATSLDDFSAKLTGLLDQITAQAGKDPGNQGVIKKLSMFIAEIKELITVPAEPRNVVNMSQDKTAVDRVLPEDVTLKEPQKEQDGQKLVALKEPLQTDNRKSNLSNELRTEDKTTPYLNNNVKPVLNQDMPKVSSPTNVSKYADTIFSQIAEKAQIALGDGQSEMKIQLKPDFLGKVNLQIRIEEGVLTAKFAAESMQVKQLIEANLNNLRQNLADQGFNVQQLQVTVGQQKDFDSYQSRQGHAGSAKGKSKPDLIGDLDAIEAVTTNGLAQEMAQRYGFEESDYDYVV